MINILKKVFWGNKKSLRDRFIQYFLLIFAILILLSIYSIYSLKNIVSQYNSTIGNLYFYNKISSEFTAANDYLDYYFSLTLIYSSEIDIEQSISNIIIDTKNIEKSVTDMKNRAQIEDLRGMFESYRETFTKADNLKSSGQPYLLVASECRIISKYINQQINKLMSEHIAQSTTLYARIQNSSQIAILLTVLGSIGLLITMLYVIISLIRNIIKPINDLSLAAKRISEGDFNNNSIYVKTEDEIGMLASSFVNMQTNIRDMILQIQEKSDLESKLREEEVKNLTITNILNETELKALQAQINPHFLFNTLNTIARMAMLENAKTTQKLIISTADLLRYSLGKINENKCTLRDEIAHTQQYLFIQKVRFGNRLSFNLNIDEDLLDIGVPSLFLQPIVENSIIHGLEPLNRDVCISINIYCDSDKIIVEVTDDGVGMGQDILSKIMSKSETSSIGLYNVNKRLELYFKNENMISISSEEGKGTMVRILLPLKREIEANKNV